MVTLIPLLVPTGVVRILRRLDYKLSMIHPIVPIIGTLLLAYLVVRIVLALLGLPLQFGWQLFGAISDNSTRVLAVYNYAAHTLAFLAAFRIIYAIRRPGEDKRHDR
jgi:hypothetical protein